MSNLQNQFDYQTAKLSKTATRKPISTEKQRANNTSDKTPRNSIQIAGAKLIKPYCPSLKQSDQSQNEIRQKLGK